MKRFVLTGFTCLLLGGCQDVAQKSNDGKSYEAQLTETELGNKVVYSVHISDVGTEKAYRGYAVQLNLVDKTWMDTTFAELSPNDTFTTEVIFSQAVINDRAEANFEVKPFDAQ